MAALSRPRAGGALPALALVLAVAAAGAGSVGGAVAAGGGGSSGAARAVALGAWVSAAPRHDPAAERAAVEGLERRIGRRLAIDQFYVTGLPDPASWDWRLGWDRRAGRVPMVTLGAGVPTAAVAAGRWDGALRRIRAALSAAGGTVLVRYAAEPENAANSGWVGSAGSYRAAWRVVHAVLSSARVRLVWSLDAGTFADPARAAAFWPGASAVDWIGADGYNWYSCRPGSRWRSFTETFAAFYRWARDRHRPLVVSEFGTVEDQADPGRKAAWLAALPAEVAAMPGLAAVVYFDSARDCPWRLDSSPAAMAGFAAAARSAALSGHLS